MTLPQAYNVVVALETLVYLTSDKENVMKHPGHYKVCQHDRWRGGGLLILFVFYSILRILENKIR